MFFCPNCDNIYSITKNPPAQTTQYGGIQNNDNNINSINNSSNNNVSEVEEIEIAFVEWFVDIL